MKTLTTILTTTLLLSNLTAESEVVVSLKEVMGKAPFVTLTAENLYATKSYINPFLSSSMPRPMSYKGGFFKLNHDYPSTSVQPSTEYPWKEITASNAGKISKGNALDYVLALKDSVSDDMKTLLYDKNTVNLPNWYQSIWIGTEREPIHGMYVGSGFSAGTLTDQNINLTTYVYTLYNATAAKTLGDIWGTSLETAMNPTITNETTQYAEGSVIVKFSFVTACGSDWSPMTDTAIWEIYAPINSSNGTAKSSTSKCKDRGVDGTSKIPALTNVYLMQFDIIVKDTQAAPETGWVFSTLVYDKDAKGKDVWDKMLPLGATWGGDPDIVTLKAKAFFPPVKVNTALTQNWINKNTPEYARSTLGWDGRLSGPNDGAVVTPAWAGGRYYHQGLATVGCINCHSSAQFPMTSFLLPTTTYPPKTMAAPLSQDNNAKALVLAKPGSATWMKYFNSNSGTTAMGPMDAEGNVTVALDYDMVTAFKAIPMWQAAKKMNDEKLK